MLLPHEIFKLKMSFVTTPYAIGTNELQFHLAGALTFAPIANRSENQIRFVNRLSLAVDLTGEETAETWVSLLATTSYFFHNHRHPVLVG
jgi:hypothetical protein